MDKTCGRLLIKGHRQISCVLKVLLQEADISDSHSLASHLFDGKAAGCLTAESSSRGLTSSRRWSKLEADAARAYGIAQAHLIHILKCLGNGP